MASLFDGIFQHSGDALINPLFSSSSKFKTAKVANAVTSVAPAAMISAGDQSTADRSASAKVKKTAKKRKAAEPAEPQQATEAGHKRSKVVASSSTKHKSSAQELQAKQEREAPAKEPQLRKRKRQDVKVTAVVKPGLAAVDNAVNDIKEISNDASAAVDETAVQVHNASLSLHCL